MFVHIGNGNVIQTKNIVVIIDCNAVSSSGMMGEMLTAGKNEIVGDKKDAKSIVVTADSVYYSSMSVSTLKKRASIHAMINKLDDYTHEQARLTHEEM